MDAIVAAIRLHPDYFVAALVIVTLGLPIIPLIRQALGIGCGSDIYKH